MKSYNIKTKFILINVFSFISIVILLIFIFLSLKVGANDNLRDVSIESNYIQFKSLNTFEENAGFDNFWCGNK